ncbi:MAG: histidine--tRNA ligase [Candidatus Thermoplasmatota archaeon]|nr:histidine--tRNA ligase [Candidatus Thermoplasmatota archaeon]
MYQVPRGTRDFAPDEMKIRRYVEENMKTTFATFGYGEIQTPTFENLELFTAKSGDSIIDEIYDFSDKGGRKLALRPELTAPVIRFYVEKLQMEPKPLKLFYFGSCFRYDRPQKGRYREFQQAGCEIIGADTPEAYAELIALAYNLLKNVGLKNITLNIGNLNIIDSMFTKISISKDCKKELLPLIDKSQFEDVYTVLLDEDVSKENADLFIDILQTSEINKIEKFIKDDNSAVEELSNLKKILDLLKNSFKVEKYQIKMSIVRGLDYYKGLVFEIDAPVLGAEKQLCGGGAYDLVSLFGGRDTATAGFAIGFDRTILALDAEQFVFPTPKTDVYIIPVNEEMTEKSIEIAQQLRKEGIITEVDLLHRGVGKSLKHANSKNSEKAIIIGSKELEKDSVTLRDMKTGDQQLVKIAEILAKLKNN